MELNKFQFFNNKIKVSLLIKLMMIFYYLWIVQVYATPAQIENIIQGGIGHLQDRDYQAATRYFRSFLEAYPQEAAFYRWYAISASFSQTQEAEQFFRSALAPNYKGSLNSHLAHYGLALLYYRGNELEKAKRTLGLLMKRPSPPPLAYVLDAHFLALDGEYEKALAKVKQALVQQENLQVAKNLEEVLHFLISFKENFDEENFDFDQESTELSAAFLEKITYIINYLIFANDDWQINQKLIEEFEKVASLIGDEDDPVVQLMKFSVNIAQWKTYGLNTVSKINDQIGSIKELFEPDSLVAYAAILETVANINYWSGDLRTSYVQFQEFERLMQNLNREREQWQALYTLKKLAYDLRDFKAANDYDNKMSRLTERFTKQTREDLLALSPLRTFKEELKNSTYLVGILLSIILLMTLIRLRVIILKKPNLFDRFKKQLGYQVERLTLQKALRIMTVVVAIFVIIILIALFALLLFYWQFVEWYRNFYLYTGVETGLLIIILMLVGLLIPISLLQRFISVRSVTIQLDQALGYRNLYETYLIHGHQHTEADDFLLDRIRTVTQKPIPASAISLWRDFFMLSSVIFILLWCMTIYQWLPLPPPAQMPSWYLPNSEPPLRLIKRSSSGQPPVSKKPGGVPVGLDINTTPVPEDRVDELDDVSSVGGLDRKGEPEDYYTEFPERPWQYPRQDMLVASDSDESAKKYIPSPIQKLPRQHIPPHYRGQWK